MMRSITQHFKQTTQALVHSQQRIGIRPQQLSHRIGQRPSSFQSLWPTNGIAGTIGPVNALSTNHQNICYRALLFHRINDAIATVQDRNAHMLEYSRHSAIVRHTRLQGIFADGMKSPLIQPLIRSSAVQVVEGKSNEYWTDCIWWSLFFLVANVAALKKAKSATLTTEPYCTLDPATPSPECRAKIQKLVDETEKRTTAWIASNNWKMYKTASNRDDIPDEINKFNQISVFKMIDEQFHPEISIWKIEAYVPEPDTAAIMKYFHCPTQRIQFDPDVMSKFHHIPISKDEDAKQSDGWRMHLTARYSDSAVDIPIKPSSNELSLSACYTNAAVGGLISPRLCLNIFTVKYNPVTKEHEMVGTYVPDEMMNEEMKDILGVSDEDLSNLVIAKNLSSHLTAKRVDNSGYSKIVYILQVNNGGWIPQWAVEIGMVDQHMIAICKRMTKWILHKRAIQSSAEKERSTLISESDTDKLTSFPTGQGWAV